MTSLKQYLLWTLGFVNSTFPFTKSIRQLFSGWHIESKTRKISKNRNSSLLVLNYHRVLPQDNPFAIDAITTHDFEAQIKVLSKYFHILPLSTAIRALENGTLKPYSVCLTFDDGYQDNYEYAFPILEKYAAPATIFLTTDFIDSEKMLWHDRVLWAFEHTEQPDLRVNEIDLDTVALDSIQSRRSVAFRVLEKLKAFDPDRRDTIIDKLYTLLKVESDGPKKIMLRWDEILRMAESGISFGAHTKTHPILSTLSDTDLYDEIVGSKKAIEQKLGAAVSTFAYPNGRSGDYDERALSVLKSAEFECAVTTQHGLNESDQNVYEILRMAPWETNPHRFLGRLLLNSIIR